MFRWNVILLRALLSGLAMLTVLTPGFAQLPADPLAAGFRNVPDAARLRMFWRVFGPAWSKEEIAFQFEELKRAGVGGVMTCFTYPVALDDPAKGIHNQQFLSPEFLDTLRYAAQKAKEVGLRFSVCGGTGWPFGGPSVSVQDAAQRLRMVTPQPLPDGKGFQLPKLRAGERYFAAFSGVRDVTAHIHGDRLEVPTGEPCRVFITGPTYMQVKRAALGAEGYVVDHFNRKAALRYLEAVVKPMLDAVPEGLLRSIFCDSLEVYNANWTRDFPAQFRKRRGYDLIPHLVELFEGKTETARDLRFDFWRTAAELAEQEFARPVHEWLKKRGVAFELEAYGTPSMGFTAARYCDVPWGEQYEWKGFSFSRFASSGAHLAGKKIIGAEAWTWTGIPNRLADTLSDLKLCSDLHFLSGENELIGVDYPYSPRSAGSPGWMPYFGPVLSRNNPQWLCFPDFAAYVNRCQWLLRQGQPVADVALYVPTEDSFANGPTDQMLLDFHLRDRLATGAPEGEFGLQKSLKHHSDVIDTILSSGYNFDGIDCFAMNTLAKVKGKELVAGDGRYSIVVLPNLTGIDLAAMEKIAQFCKAGGTVIATRRLPDRVYGLHQETETQRLKALIAEMFGPVTGDSLRSCNYGEGVAFFAPDERDELSVALGQSRVLPDLALVATEVSSVHRRVGDRDFYFVTNVSDEGKDIIKAEFRGKKRAVTIWNPMTGEITPHPIKGYSWGITELELYLPPRGSVFVCLSPGSPQIKPWRDLAPGPRVSYRMLGTHWHVTFDGPDAPPPYLTPNYPTHPTSWTDWPGAKFFSGRAIYTKTFQLPAPLPKHALLQFNEIHEVAKVVVNGQIAGFLWTPTTDVNGFKFIWLADKRPRYEIDVRPFLKPGKNTLEITVANLPVNRVLGLPDEDLRSLRAVFGNRFPDPEEKRLMPQPAPSGLIGDVVLVTFDHSP